MNTIDQPRVFQSSDLSRHPKAVFDAVEEGPVEITRRDGSTLVLMQSEDADAQSRLLRLAGQLVAAAVARDGRFVDHLAERFPWMLALSADDRAECAEEVLRAARASFDTGKAHLAVATLTAWQGTAEALAAGLHRHEVEWLDADQRVERP